MIVRLWSLWLRASRTRPRRDGVPFSEVERKMLYFSETAWTLPDILNVNDEFDRNYDQDVYEKKVSQLIKKAVSRARQDQREEFEAWTAAIRRLSKDDRHLLVMVERAGLGQDISATSFTSATLGLAATLGHRVCLGGCFWGSSLGHEHIVPRDKSASQFTWSPRFCLLGCDGLSRSWLWFFAIARRCPKT